MDLTRTTRERIVVNAAAVAYLEAHERHTAVYFLAPAGAALHGVDVAETPEEIRRLCGGGTFGGETFGGRQ